MSRRDAEQVIRHYGDKYYEMLKRRPYRPAMGCADDEAIAEKFLAWCREHRVNPITMIDIRFSSLWKMKKVAPRFNALRAPTLLPFVEKEEAQEAAADTQVAVFDQAVRDMTIMTPGHEQVRQRYFMRQATMLCVENSLNGGYDPRSRYCPHCPDGGECEAKTKAKWGFDVTALRAGKIHLLPAPVRQVLRGWDGGLSV